MWYHGTKESESDCCELVPPRIRQTGVSGPKTLTESETHPT
jgi:hypothetical protein